MNHSPTSLDDDAPSHPTVTRRSVLCGAGVAIVGLFSGCSSIPFFGSGVKVVEWNQEGALRGETTFDVVIKNQGLSKTSAMITIELHPESMAGGKTLAQKSKTVTLARGEKRTVQITMTVPDATKSWMIRTNGL